MLRPNSTNSAAPERVDSDSRGEQPPIDFDHLSRQTMGDRELESEVLGLFIMQATATRDRIKDAASMDRSLLAHTLMGSARAVGAFAVADCAAVLEKCPGDDRTVERLARLIDEARDFIASGD
jgi:HPt (histidine-containing phosphotransfer) domain-containing protein